MTFSWTDALPYFGRDELACRGSGELILDVRFAAALPALRAKWGAPLNPTSVCRSPDHNAAVNGHPRSLHLTHQDPSEISMGRDKRFGTMAADIDWGDWSDKARREFAVLARSERWAVGLHPDFCHIDLRRVIGLGLVTYEYGDWSEAWGKHEVELWV